MALNQYDNPVIKDMVAGVPDSDHIHAIAPALPERDGQSAETEVTFPDPSNPDPIDPDIIHPAVIDPADFPVHDDDIDPDEDIDVDEDIDPLPDADLPEPDRPDRDISNRQTGL